MKKHYPIFLFLFLLNILYVQAQPIEQSIKVIVAPDHDNWTYKAGEKVKFSIAVLQNGNPLKNVNIRYEVGPEKMEPLKKDSTALASGTLNLDGGTLKSPGFLRCLVIAKVEGKEYRNIGTAGFDPLSISPTEENPADFIQFWDK